MKAFDAIHLARELSRRGVPAVPVFWALTDDHDLQEIAQTARPTPEGPQRLILEGADRQNRQPVGRLPIPEGIAAIVDAFRPDAPGDDGKRVLEAFARRSAPGTLVRRSVHRDAARPRGAGSAARARAARRGRAPAHGRALPRSGRQGRRPARGPALDRGEAARRGTPGSGAGPRGVFVLRDRRAGAPPHRRRPGRRRPGRGRAGLALGRRHNPAGPEVVSLPHGGQRARGGGDRVPRAEPSALPDPRRDAPGAVSADARRSARPRRAAPGRAARARGRGPARRRPPRRRRPSCPKPTPPRRWRARPTPRSPAFEAPLTGLDPSLTGALETARKKIAYQFEQLAERARKAVERKSGVASNRGIRLAQALMPDGIPAERVYPPLAWILNWGARHPGRAAARPPATRPNGAAVIDLALDSEGGAHGR